MEELKRELIKKHLEFNQGDYFHSSVKHYSENGKASGSFFMALKAMMDEYNEQLNIHNVIKCEYKGHNYEVDNIGMCGRCNGTDEM